MPSVGRALPGEQVGDEAVVPGLVRGERLQQEPQHRLARPPRQRLDEAAADELLLDAAAHRLRHRVVVVADVSEVPGQEAWRWMKEVGGLRKLKVVGWRRAEHASLVGAAFNLRRMATLLPAA